ncbi:unnamed protein product [Acanthoscelides obtectus]|uniref:Uncharacterized protein n=1 Tax=Acanthoscelides obtectus TaxID=200917 RepID=A0A9P0NTV3_ACAOB|nr:unnamed protein product [Acanthoscelides obtectus]CAK1634841.1 Leucine-rich repeat-containing protein 15 [Acanthoscelides obtectus]
MYKNPGIRVIALVLLINSLVASDLLFKKGWYKSSKKGSKTLVNDVEHIDNKQFPDSKYLRVSARLPILVSNSVRNLTKLSTLKLSFCGITVLKPGAFINLPNLTTLALIDNKIESIPRGVFNNLNVGTLFLQRNQIETIDAEAFDDMPNLFRIKLNANKISTWNGEWFKNTPRLSQLYFRRNKIQVIPERAFKNLKATYLPGGRIELEIYLSKNLIREINPKAFDGIDTIRKLMLDRNNIQELNGDIFKGMKHIDVIFLSKNQLRELPKNLLSALHSDLLTLDLAGNHNFTYLPYEIVSKVKITEAGDIRRLDCESVFELVKKLAEQNKTNEIKTGCTEYIE